MRYKIKDGDIQRTVQYIHRTRKHIFKAQQRHLRKEYTQLRRMMYQTTMVATGETRSKIFSKSGIVGSNYFRCVTGYNPTSNNQSFSQEFEMDKKVHKSIDEHYRYKKAGGKTPKCSRHPTDLFALYGKKYDSNSSARRGALKWAVRKTFSVPNVVANRTGGGFAYVPDLSNMTWRLAVIARTIIGGGKRL